MKEAAIHRVNNQRRNTMTLLDATSFPPERTLVVIIIGMLLGAVGQGIRIVAGLKKLNEEAARRDVPRDSLLTSKVMGTSLLITFVVGPSPDVFWPWNKWTSITSRRAPTSP